MMGRVFSQIVLLPLLMLGASSGAQGRDYAGSDAGASDEVGTLPQTIGQTGMASWYGKELAGRRTASGEAFDPHGLTAAHRTLPIGTLLEVTDTQTQKSVVVRVNDRGPVSRARLIDLSYGAARVIGMDRKGVAEVMVRVVDGPVAPIASDDGDHSGYVVQIASFSSQQRAEAAAQSLGAHVVAYGESLWRVQLGPFDSGDDASQGLNLARQSGYDDARILLVTDQ